jgi:hypothetical protein
MSRNTIRHSLYHNEIDAQEEKRRLVCEDAKRHELCLPQASLEDLDGFQLQHALSDQIIDQLLTSPFARIFVWQLIRVQSQLVRNNRSSRIYSKKMQRKGLKFEMFGKS